MLTKVDKIRVYATLKQPFCPLRLNFRFLQRYKACAAHTKMRRKSLHPLQSLALAC